LSFLSLFTFFLIDSYGLPIAALMMRVLWMGFDFFLRTVCFGAFSEEVSEANLGFFFKVDSLIGLDESLN
jgi:hypothetical protein